MNVILCGLPGSGKTVIGQLLAQKLQFSFLDTDPLIEQYYASQKGFQLSCREIVRKEGIEFFRSLESEIVGGLLSVRNHVIATGGGTLISYDNACQLQALGQLIYLKENVETLLIRILSNGIPTYLDSSDPKGSFNNLARERESIYSSFSHLTIDTEGRSPDEVIKIVLNLINHSIFHPESENRQNPQFSLIGI